MSFSFSLKEEIALIRTYIWHTKRDEVRLRRKLSSIEPKMEQSRNQLRDVLKFMKQHQNGIDAHLQKLSKTETTLRDQLSTLCADEVNDIINTSNNGNVSITKQSKQAKKLNNALIEIVKHRNDHEYRLDSSQSTFKVVQNLLNDETKQIDHNHLSQDIIDHNISPSVSEYIYYRQEMAKIQNELVECVEKREIANQSLYFAKIKLKQMIPKRCVKCQCNCKHRDKLLLNNKILTLSNSNNNNYDNDSDDSSDTDIEEEDMVMIKKGLLKNELIQLGQDIHQRSGLIRQQRRNGICHLRVFVGSELITWIVKSNIVKTRYEASILSSLLIDGGFVYCAYEPTSTSTNAPSSHSLLSASSATTKKHKIFGKHPGITLKLPTSSSSLLSEGRSKSPQPLLHVSTPNRLLFGHNYSSDGNNNSHNNKYKENNYSCSSAPSSVLSVGGSSISGMSGSSSSTYRSSSSSVELNGINTFINPTCACSCKYCFQSNKPIILSFQDSSHLYRFRCDDSRIERISKMGWLEKFGRFRSKKRHYIWDGVRRQLREYKTKGDIVPLYKYPFTSNTKINADQNGGVLSIIFYEPQYHVLKLKAANQRDRDSWIRVLINDNNNNSDNDSDINEDDYSTTNNNPKFDDDGSLITGNNNNKKQNMDKNNVDNNYEEYRHLRMTNRLKWSTLFTTLKATHQKIQSFREFIIAQDKMPRSSRTDIESELNKLFNDKDSPISVLFHSFTRLFLEPFYKININDLEIESVDSIISLCVDDLSSFLQICQTRLVNLLIPSTLRVLSSSSFNKKPRPVIKLLHKLAKRCIYSHCFCSSVYNTIFPLYQRVHHVLDQKLYHISLNNQHFSTKHYQISEELQIDKEWVKQKNSGIEKMLQSQENNKEKNKNKKKENNNINSIGKLDTSNLKNKKNNIKWNKVMPSIMTLESPTSQNNDDEITNNLYPKLLLHPGTSPAPMKTVIDADTSIDEPSLISSSTNSDLFITNSDIISSSLSLTPHSYNHIVNSSSNSDMNVNNNKFNFPIYQQQKRQHRIATNSPFQPCIDKLWEMTYCHTPTKKLECLVELQQSVIKCIDEYRQKYVINKQHENDDEDEDEDEDDNDDDTKSNNMDDDDDDDDGIHSVESLDIVSESDDGDIIENNDSNNKKNKNNKRDHGIMDNDDMNELSLISYESADEYWTQSLQQSQQQSKPSIDIENNKKTNKKNKKKKKKNKNGCKQLLIASDDMIPLFCYVLIQSQIQSINAEIFFMNDFMSDEEKQMKAGFYLTTLQAATSALLDKKLPIR